MTLTSSGHMVVRYAIAVLSMVLAVALTLFIRQWFSLNPTPFILIGVIAASWYGGRYPGLLACLIADLSIDYLFEDPMYQFNLAPVHFVRLLILCVMSLLASSRKNTEDKLRTRERQQAAVAWLGQHALSSVPLAELLPKAADMVKSTLEVDLSSVCEKIADEDKLCFSSGAGWDEDLIGQEFEYGHERSITSSVLSSGQSVLIRDLRTEQRFEIPDLLTSRGVRSLVIVPVSQRDKPYGVLAALSKQKRLFSKDDVNFLLSVANIIGEAAERLRSEKETREQKTWLNTTLSSIGDGVIATDREGMVSFMNPIAEQLTGWDQTSARGLPLEKIFEIVNEETRQRVINPVSRVLAEGLIVGLANHTILISKTGDEIPIEDSAAPIADGDEIQGVVLVFSDVTERKAAERARREADIMQSIVRAQESERNRIARDLHDHMGQRMTALRLSLGSLSEKCGDDPALRKAIDDLQSAALLIDRDIGFLSWELRPTELAELGLQNALASFVREWGSQYGMTAEFHGVLVDDEKDILRLEDAIETNLYRIAQEGLNNILKHSGALNVSVLLHQRDGSIVLTIEDDGSGFDSEALAGDEAKPGGLGLVGMRERAAILNGTLEVESEIGVGTTILVRIPLR